MLVNFKEGLSGSPNLINKNEIPYDKLKPNKDYYVSIFKYNNIHKDLVAKTGSISGITDVTTNDLVWDFDSSDLQKAQADTITLCTRLVENYNVDPEQLQIYMSGSKGFHVKLHIDDEITPDQFKQATCEIAKDLETFDTVVCDPARIIRLENTKHPKSGLYKIPLAAEEIDTMSIEEIRTLAKNKRDVTFNKLPASLPKSLYTLPKKDDKPKAKVDESEFDFSEPPKGWKKYKWAIAQGWYEQGERHNALMILAATCRGLGYDRDTTYYLCKSSLQKHYARTGLEQFDKTDLYENILESTFAPNWNGGQYGLDHPLVQKICKRLNIDVTKDVDHIVQLHDIEAEFIDYVMNIDANTIKTGIEELDEKLPLTVGMNLGIIGAASSGKTAMALKILENTSAAGVISVFASLDMRRNRLFEKLLYRLSGLSRDELYHRIQTGEASEIFQLVRDKYKNVYFYDRSCPSVEDIRAYILALEEKTGQKVKLVMLDYFERVNAERSDDTAASKEVSGKLQDLVNDFNVCLITLVQPNKFSLSGGPDSPILNYTAIKGSSFLYQSFRSIISIWRPFFNPELKEHDKFLQMAILKNDLGELDMLNFGWNGKQGEIWSIGEEGQEELERLLDMKEERRNPSRDEDPNGRAWG